MATSKWDQIQTLFFKALECAPGEREALLDRECDDADVRSEVEAMLIGEESPHELSVLARPPLERQRALEPMVPGQRVGRYQIIERIGTGGMGEVYRAERVDDEYRQQVALKVLRADLALPELANRFRTERQILAQLQHPNVTILLDGGATEDGRPYLVMQLETGLPLTTYADEHGLTIPQRLELFITVCEAVQYAHSNLVVHRDLKPSNVLVDDEGRPKLLDFGVAKILAGGVGAGADQTRDMRMLTPEYAAPEQLRGEAITTGTDVYALGILLHELMVGSPPFRADGTAPLEFHRRVCEEAPTRPSDGVLAAAKGAVGAQATSIAELRGVGPAKLFQSLKGDLDQIILTALRKEPARRYPSAGALAEDVRRFLAGLPVWAQPDSPRYRMRKFLRRHRLGVGAAASFVSLLGVFAAAMAVQSERLAQERDRAQTALARAEEVQEFLVGLFDASDPMEEQDKLTALDLLARGAARADELSDQPQVQAEMLAAVGRAYRNLGQLDLAEPPLERALALRRESSDATPEDVARGVGALAMLRYEQGTYDDAEAAYLEFLELRRAIDGPTSFQIADALSSLGAIQTMRRDFKSAEGYFAEALAQFDGRAPETMDEHERTAYTGALNNLGLTLAQEGEFARAEPYLQQALDLNRKELGDSHPTAITNVNNLATVYFRQGKLEAAERSFQDVLERRRALYGNDHASVAAPLNNLAQLKTQQGRLNEAEAYAREAVAIQRRTQGAQHPLLALGLKNLARLLLAEGKYAEAEPVALESLAIFRSQFDDDHDQVRWVRELLLELYTKWDRPDLAARYRAAP